MGHRKIRGSYEGVGGAVSGGDGLGGGGQDTVIVERALGTPSEILSGSRSEVNRNP